MRTKISALAATCTAAAALLAVGAAGAANTPCTGIIGPITINGNVDAGPGCLLDRTTVNGSVTVNPGGSLVTLNAAISRNLKSQGATSILSAFGSTIGGNVTIRDTSGFAYDGGGNPYSVSFGTGTVGGNIEISGDSVALIYVNSTTVGGDVLLHDNAGSSVLFGAGGISMYNDTVSGSVELFNNSLGGINLQNGPAGGGGSIGGDLQVLDNSLGDGAYLYGNSVGGNLQMFNNTASSPFGELRVDASTVGRTLNCRGNTPAASNPGPLNTATKMLGECAGF